jgi:hypothetical protein
MSLSRKDYEAIAKAITDTKQSHRGLDEFFYEAVEGALEELEERLADYFLTDNPRFDATRFYGACADLEVGNG